MTVVDLDVPFTSEAADQEAWSKMARHWVADGALSGYLNELEVYGDSSGRQVKLRTGACFIQGHLGEIASEKTISISANSSGNPRIDRVIMRLDTVAKTIEYTVLVGTPAGSPAAPSITRSGTVWDISLAQVAVANGASTIAAGNVTNERPISGPYIVGSYFPSVTSRDLHLTSPKVGQKCEVALTSTGLIRDSQEYNGSAWVSQLTNSGFLEYTPTWSVVSGTPPSIGNGTLKAWWRPCGGKLIHLAYYILAGSTTTFGSGVHTISLPSGFTAVSMMADGPQLVGSGFFYDATNLHPNFPFPLSNATYITIAGPTELTNTNMRIQQGGSGGFGGSWASAAYLMGNVFVPVQ